MQLLATIIPRRSGHIINIASIAGKGFAGTSNAIYAASKGAARATSPVLAEYVSTAPYNGPMQGVHPAEKITPIKAEAA